MLVMVKVKVEPVAGPVRRPGIGRSAPCPCSAPQATARRSPEEMVCDCAAVRDL